MSIFAKITDYFTSSFQELKKVSWPSRNQVFYHTIFVLITILIAMLLIAALDFGLSKIFQYAIYNNF